MGRRVDDLLAHPHSVAFCPEGLAAARIAEKDEAAFLMRGEAAEIDQSPVTNRDGDQGGEGQDDDAAAGLGYQLKAGRCDGKGDEHRREESPEDRDGVLTRVVDA